jgi:hypothetical protein
MMGRCVSRALLWADMHCPFGASPCPKGATAYQPGVGPRVWDTKADAF